MVLLRCDWLSVPINMVPFNKFFHRTFGLLPSTKSDLFFSRLLELFLTACVMCKLAYLYQNICDFSAVAMVAPWISIMCGILFAHFLVVRRRTLYSDLIKEIESDYEKYNLSSLEVARTRLRRMHIMVMSLMLSIPPPVVLWMIQPLASGSKELIFPSLFPFSINSDLRYALVYFGQAIALLSAGTITLTVNGMFVEVTQHSSAHLEHMSEVLESTLEDRLLTQEEVKHKLMWCVKRHITLLRRIRVIDQIFSQIAFVNCLFYLMCTSVVALETVTLSSNTPYLNIAKQGSLLLVSLLELFPSCISSHHLLDCQETVSRALYGHQWFSATDDIRRTLSIMKLRAQVPCAVTVGGFGALQLATYTESMKLVYTIFAVLYQLKNS